MFLLLVEDIIEEVEVVAVEEQGKLSSQEREEKPEEQGQEHPSTGASSDQPPLEALEALAVLQVELSSTHETDPKAYLRLQRKDHQRRKHPLSQTSCIIQGNPGLWANAVSFVPLLRGQMLRRMRRKDRSRRRGGAEGTRQPRGGQGNWGARELRFGGAVISTGTVPAEPGNLSTCTCLSK